MTTSGHSIAHFAFPWDFAPVPRDCRHVTCGPQPVGFAPGVSDGGPGSGYSLATRHGCPSGTMPRSRPSRWPADPAGTRCPTRSGRSAARTPQGQSPASRRMSAASRSLVVSGACAECTPPQSVAQSVTSARAEATTSVACRARRAIDAGVPPANSQLPMPTAMAPARM